MIEPQINENIHIAPSNNNFLGLLMAGGGDNKAGLLLDAIIRDQSTRNTHAHSH